MSAAGETWRLDGRTVAITHPDKLYWPNAKLTKGDMLGYYRAMAPVMLPHFRDRPVTLRLFPRGIGGFSYYRRSLPQDAPDWLRRVTYETETDRHAIQLPLVDDAAGLIWLANLGAIEFHLWGSRAPRLHEPDVAIFDLDPGEEATFAHTLEAALRVRDALDEAGVRGYPKTSGGSGLHIYVPLAPGQSFDGVRAWVKDLAGRLAAAYPDLIAVAHGATHRGDRVTVDYAQNSVGRNTAAPYTLRARPGAPVSMPVTWAEVEAGRIRPADFTLASAPDRVVKVGDLFRPVLEGGQGLPRLR